MQIYSDLSEINKNNNTIITLGTFDGIHLGHKQIIEKVVNDSKKISGRHFLITFNPHPRKIVTPESKIQLLNTIDEKIQILSQIGIENLLIVNFTKQFSLQSPEEFVDKYLVNGIGVKEVVIGYDHHFGKGRGGDIDILTKSGSENNFKVSAVPEFMIGEEVVSSTKIRNALHDGDVVKAAKMLGRYYSFEGEVIQGDNRGKELGFPTANLNLKDDDKLLPQIGIYAVECIVDEIKQYGLLSIGKRPTFHSSGDIVPEVYIFDFDEKIYGKEIKVNMVERIRGEEKFDSVDELVKQMNKDKEIGIEILSKLIN
jgi:riboflavin kinase/FMN adenylyltransferase